MRLALRLIGLVVLLASAGGCVTAPAEVEPFPNTRIYSAPFDDVWGALIDYTSNGTAPIQAIEKESGLLRVGPAEVSGLSLEGELREIASLPRSSLAIWSSAKLSMSYYVRDLGDSRTSLKANAQISAYDSNYSMSWYQAPSRGTLERRAFDGVLERLNCAYEDVAPAAASRPKPEE